MSFLKGRPVDVLFGLTNLSAFGTWIVWAAKAVASKAVAWTRCAMRALWRAANLAVKKDVRSAGVLCSGSLSRRGGALFSQVT